MTGKYWARTAVCVWVIFLAVVCIKTIAKPLSANIYPTFASAGSDFAAGQKLYDADHPVDHPYTDNFRYSPIVAAGFWPFSLMSWGVGGAIWRLLCAAVFLSGLWAFARRIGPSLALPGFFLLAVPLCFYSFHNGQVNPIVIGWLLWATVWAYDGKWNAAAVALAAAILMKVYPISLAGLFVLLAPVRLAVPLLLALVAGVVLPYAFQPAEYVTSQYQYWFANLQSDDRTQFPLWGGYQDFHMLLRVVGIEIPRQKYFAVQGAMGLLAAAVVFRQIRLGIDRRTITINAFTLGSCWMILFGTVETATFTLLAPVFARELLDAKGRPRWALPVALAGAGFFLVGLIALTLPHAIHRPIIALGVQPLGALLVSIAAVGRVLACRPTPAESPAS